MFALFTLASLFLAVGAVPLTVEQHTEDWETYKIQFNKIYSSAQEDLLRKQIFLENKKEVSKHNEDFKKGLTTYRMGINHLSDMLPQELEELHLPNMNVEDSDLFAQFRPANFFYHEDLPKSVDWRVKGAVTSVKEQKRCGSCWAFSTVGSVEGQVFIKTGNLTSLSAQNLIDCDQKSYGCDGGILPSAFRYAQDHGLETESSYPYEHQAGQCRFNESKVAARIDGFRRIKRGDESQLMAAVATEGPVSACINTLRSFGRYYDGVYYEEACSNEHSNHCVLVVGYGTTDDGQDYWIVKNSWGTFFGVDGYIKMARNKNNMCAIATWALIPSLSNKN